MRWEWQFKDVKAKDAKDIYGANETIKRENKDYMASLGLLEVSKSHGAILVTTEWTVG